MAKTKPQKKTSKLSSLLSKLNPNSPAKKLLAFVLVFAVLGGGYYAYRSFAGTGGITFSAGAMSGGACRYSTNSKGTFCIERESSAKVNLKMLSGRTYWMCVNMRSASGKPWNFSGIATVNYETPGHVIYPYYFPESKSGWIRSTHAQYISITSGTKKYKNTTFAVDSITNPDDNFRIRNLHLSETGKCPG